MADLGLTGLASGVDTSGIVDQLMAIERQGRTRLQLKQKGVDTQAATLKDLKARLDALNAAAKDLRAPATWAETQTIESTDPRVAVARTGGAPIGGYSVRVTQLASSAQKTFGWTQSASASQLTLDDAAPGKDPVAIDIPANATIADVAAIVNGRGDLPVFAAVVGGNKLVLSSRATGAAVDFSATGAQLSGPSATVAGRDAKYFLDDDPTEHASASNVVEDAVPGLRFTFKGVTVGAASITVGEPGVDRAKVLTEVKQFVDAYNALVNATRAKTGEQRVVAATTDADKLKGMLFGDSGLTGMLSKLRLGVGAAYTGVGNPQSLDDLADLGITTGALGASFDQTKAGTLVVDEAKLTAALERDAQGVRRLLGGTGTAAFAQDVEQMTKDFSASLSARIDSAGQESRRLTDDLSRTDTRLSAKQAMLKAQFAAMESALSQAQAQQSWLTGQLNALATR